MSIKRNSVIKKDVPSSMAQGTCSNDDTKVGTAIDLSEPAQDTAEAVVGNRLIYVQLSEDEHIFVGLPDEPKSLVIHYHDDDGLCGYISCLGASCPLCEIGRKAKTIKILVVYRLLEEAMESLGFGDTHSVSSLHSQLRDFSSTAKEEYPRSVVVMKGNGTQYRLIGIHDVFPNASDVISTLVSVAREQGAKSLSLSSEELRQLPSVAQELKSRATR